MSKPNFCITVEFTVAGTEETVSDYLMDELRKGCSYPFEIVNVEKE